MPIMSGSLGGATARKRGAQRWLVVFFVLAGGIAAALLLEGRSHAQSPAQQQQSLLGQSQPDVDRKNSGCVSCHTATDEPSMHPTGTVRLACVDCHGGDATAILPSGSQPGSAEYAQLKKRAHPQPTDSALAGVSGNPPRLYTKWLRENYAYVRFVNPGDLRVAAQTCGTAGCHAPEVLKVKTSMMTHGGMLWGAALYNNGSVPFKNTMLGESYSADGMPQTIDAMLSPTAESIRLNGELPMLTPLDRRETAQPGNVLRVFERGVEKKG